MAKVGAFDGLVDTEATAGMAGWRSITFGAAAVVMALVCASLAAAYWLTQPPRIILGYLDGASPETLILKAFEGRMTRERKPPFRLVAKAFANIADLRAAFTAGTIDLAPFATWEAVPDSAETVVILQRLRILLVALDDGDARRTAAEKVVIVAGDDHDFMLGRLIVSSAFDISSDPQAAVSPSDAARALLNGRAEIAAIAASNGTKLLRQLIAALPAAAQGKVAVRAAPRADQLARQNPAIESVELKIGAASSDPLLPDDDIETLSVTTRLMARRALPESTVTDLTRLLVSQQRRLAQATPAAMQLEPPPSERGAAFPTHNGAAAYVDGEERTFFERYGDWLYLGLFGVSGIGSIGAGLVSWRDGARRRADLRRLGALRRLVGTLAEARTLSEVELAAGQRRRIMNEVLLAATRLQISQTDLQAFAIADNLFEATRRERAEQLLQAGASR